MSLFCPCPKGLEEALAKELSELGASNVKALGGGVSFEAKAPDTALALSYRVNLHSRLASRVLIRLAQGTYKKEKALFELAYDVPWESHLHWKNTLRVDTTATRSPVKSLNFVNLLIKDAICDRLRDKQGNRPDIDTENPGHRVFVFLEAEQASIYLDTSGKNLFMRGWRGGDDKGAAPLKENLAAGLVALSGWQPLAPLQDIFCGSGTILIEAAQQALGIAPGWQRSFGFEKLNQFSAKTWQEVKAQSELEKERLRKTVLAPIAGSDQDRDVLTLAKLNAQRAGLPREAISFKHEQAESAHALPGQGIIISNPPYGERLEESFDHVALGNNLRNKFAGWRAGFLTSDRGLPGRMRLRESRKVPLYNGTLDCRFFMFEMRR